MQLLSRLVSAAVLCTLCAGQNYTTVPNPQVHARGYSKPKTSLKGALLVRSVAAVAVPAAFDWRATANIPVVNQGNCGSCWAFATVATVEYYVKILTGQTVDFSEQQVTSCDRNNGGCNGGNWAYPYLMSNPPQFASCYPYTSGTTGATGTCSTACASSPYRVTSWSYVDSRSASTPTIPSEASIKSAIYQYGPLLVAVTVGNSGNFDGYSSGTFTFDDTTTTDHAVVLVGWDDAKGAWIMRNSWGTGWGQSGYMYIKYGVSRIGEDAAYAVVSTTAPAATPSPVIQASRSRSSSLSASRRPSASPSKQIAPASPASASRSISRSRSPSPIPSPGRGPSASPVVNDRYTSAKQLTCGSTVSGDTNSATADSVGVCNGLTHTGPQLWYYIDLQPGQFVASTCNSATAFDTLLSVFSSSMACITGNDDDSTCRSGGTMSTLSMAITTAGRYYLMVHGWNGVKGPFALTVTCSASSSSRSAAGSPRASPLASPLSLRSPASSPSLSALNDQCPRAMPLSCGTVVSGSTSGVINDNQAVCGGTVQHTSGQLWYYVDTPNRRLVASLCNAATTWDTQLTVFSGSSCGSLTCVGSNDDFCGSQSQFSNPSWAAGRYYIMVHGYGTAAGSFSLSVTCQNDQAASAEPLTCGSTAIASTKLAIPDAVPSCNLNSHLGPQLWYAVDLLPGQFTISTCNTATVIDSIVSVYTQSSTGALTCVTSNDDDVACASNPQASTVSLSSTGGRYYVMVHDYYGATGAFSLQATCIAPVSEKFAARRTSDVDSAFDAGNSQLAMLLSVVVFAMIGATLAIYAGARRRQHMEPSIDSLAVIIVPLQEIQEPTVL